MDDAEAYIKKQLKKFDVKYSSISTTDGYIKVAVRGNRADYKKFINSLYMRHIKLISCTYGCWRFIVDD